MLLKKALLLDTKNTLWVGTDSIGLWQLDLANPDSKPRQRFAGADIRELSLDRSGNLWIATYDQGLWRIVAGSNRATQVSAEPKTVRTVVQMPDGDIWTGSDSGITVFSTTSGARLDQSVPELPDVMHLFLDDSSGLWISTASGLYHRPRPEDDLVFYNHQATDPFSLSESFVELVYQDRNANIWVGTWLAGVNLLPAHSGPFTIMDNDPVDGETWDNSATAVIEDHQGRIWTTMYRGVGVCYWNEVAQRWVPAIERGQRAESSTDALERILGFDPDNGRIWTLSNKGRLGYIDSGSETLVWPQQQPLEGAVPEDVNVVAGRLHVATQERGLVIVDLDSLEVVDQIDVVDGLSTNSVQTSQVIDGALWLGTPQGIAIYDPDSQRLTRQITAEEQGLSHNPQK